LSRHIEIDGTFGGDSETIGKSLSGTKRPAAPALALVLRTVDEARPLGARVELSRKVPDGGFGNIVGAIYGISGELDTKKAMRFSASHTLKALVKSSSPSGGLGIDGLDDAGIIDEQRIIILQRDGTCNSEENKKGDDGHTHIEFFLKHFGARNLSYVNSSSGMACESMAPPLGSIA
jgi:hypothetical protein